MTSTAELIDILNKCPKQTYVKIDKGELIIYSKKDDKKIKSIKLPKNPTHMDKLKKFIRETGIDIRKFPHIVDFYTTNEQIIIEHFEQHNDTLSREHLMDAISKYLIEKHWIAMCDEKTSVGKEWYQRMNKYLVPKSQKYQAKFDEENESSEEKESEDSGSEIDSEK